MKTITLFIICIMLSGCATRRYVRQQIVINNCVQTLRAIDRESGILYAAAEMVLRLQKRNKTTQKINEAGQ